MSRRRTLTPNLRVTATLSDSLCYCSDPLDSRRAATIRITAMTRATTNVMMASFGRLSASIAWKTRVIELTQPPAITSTARRVNTMLPAVRSSFIEFSLRLSR